jgi:fructose-specific PTS system IIA-like component
MLFLDRGEPPGEDEQVAHYTRAVAAAAGRRVIIRTLDVGGDKPLPYLRLPREDNPFLGSRAVRLYEFEALPLPVARSSARRAQACRYDPMVSCLDRK